MSKYADLEMLANKATPEPWWIDSHGMTMMSLPDLQVVFNHPQQSVAVRNEETGNLSHWRNDWDASFIATANPQTRKPANDLGTAGRVQITARGS